MSTRRDPRALALEALVRIDDGAYSHILLPELLRHHALDEDTLEPRDRAFVTELVYGTVRMRRTLDFILSRVLVAADRQARSRRAGRLAARSASSC